MIDALIVLNNYFHDLSVALIPIASFAAVSMFTRTLADGSKESIDLFRYVFPKLRTVVIASLIFFIVGGVIRVLSLSSFEWADATRNGQTVAFKAKGIMLSILFVYGIYLWAVTSRRIKKEF